MRYSNIFSQGSCFPEDSIYRYVKIYWYFIEAKLHNEWNTCHQTVEYWSELKKQCVQGGIQKAIYPG